MSSPSRPIVQVKRNCRRPPSSVAVDVNDVSLDVGRGRGLEGEQKPSVELNNHPLYNDVVLGTLFQYVAGNDLKSCRLVCQKWRLRTLPFIGSRFLVTITGKKGRVKRFVKLFGSSKYKLEFPKFEQFILGPFDTKEEFGYLLLRLCGQTVKEFKLTSEKNAPYCDQIEDISALLRSAPNLESFSTSRRVIRSTGGVVKLFPDSVRTEKPKLSFLKTLDLIYDWASYVMKICPTFYEELFEAAENLSTLIVMVSDLFLDNPDKDLDILKAIEKVGRESKIENLKMQGVTSAHFDILHRMGLKPNGLKLKQLDFKNSGSQFDWCQLISVFRDTLVVLRMRCSYRNEIINRIPLMPKLKVLYFHMTGGTHLICENFKKTFPALENVDLSFWTSEQFEALLTGDEINYNLKASLRCQFPMTTGIFNRIIRLFQNLRKLECDVTTQEDGVEVIKGIWTNLTQLDYLAIYATLPTSTNLDSLVTGIPVGEIMRMRDMDGFFVSLENQNPEDRSQRILKETNKHDDLGSIRNLTNLSFLSLHLSVRRLGSRKLNYLTDFTGYFGFYALKSLRHLNISNSEISKPCAEILVKDLGLISRRFCRAKTGTHIIPPLTPIGKLSDESGTFPVQL